MEENKKSRIAEISIHPFKPLPGAPEGGSQILGQESKETITTTEVKVYTSKVESDLIHIPNQPQARKNLPYYQLVY